MLASYETRSLSERNFLEVTLFLTSIPVQSEESTNVEATKAGFLPQILPRATQLHSATYSMGKAQRLLERIEFLSRGDFSIRFLFKNYQ